MNTHFLKYFIVLFICMLEILWKKVSVMGVGYGDEGQIKLDQIQ